MQPKVEEKTLVVISNPFKKDWMPEWKKVGDEVFVKLDKWNEDCFKFLTGQCLRTGRRVAPQHHYFPF